MTGDVIEHTPGARVPVEVVANANGNVATRGLGVAVAGENEDMAQAELTDTVGTGAYTLLTDPDEFTGDNADYAAGDSAGTATAVGGSGHELWLSPIGGDFDPSTTGTDSAAIGDEVEFAAGGQVQQYGANASLPLGKIVQLGQTDFFTGDAVQVRLYR